MNRYFIILIFLFLSAFSIGQESRQSLVGKVSFISSQNTYVRFSSTEGISAGDTLYMSADGKIIPVLKVTGLSSVSCVCTSVSGINIPLDHLIIAFVRQAEKKEPQEITTQNLLADTSGIIKSDSSAKVAIRKSSKQDISGSISANSYSDFSDTGMPDSYRFRYTLSLDASNIADSKFSFCTYISFRHKAGEWDTIRNNIFNGLKIFDLAVIYNPNETTHFILGRKINNRIASIGSIDGFQAEKSFGIVTIGAVAGFRPDYADYGFNSSLFQYGAYIGLDTKGTSSYSANTIALLEQMNNSATDRRFLYFQHSSSLAQKISLFSTFEIDLYKLDNGQPKNAFDLTSLYFSLRYRMTKRFSISGSYDTRKNIMYYETYKTYIDRIIEDERRQGFRLQADYSVSENIVFGINSGYRFLKSDPHPSMNGNGYFTFRHTPGMKFITSTISGTYLKTSFINGWTAALNIAGDFYNGKIRPGIGYRYVDYALPENSIGIIQNIAEVNLAVNLARKLFLSVNYEGTFESAAKYNRVYLQLRKRF